MSWTRIPQQLGSLFSYCSCWGWWSRRLLPLGGHVKHKVHDPVAVEKFIVIPGNQLGPVVIKSNTSSRIKGRRVGITVKVTGDNLVLSVAQVPCEGPSRVCFITLLMPLYLAAFSRWLAASIADILGVVTWKTMPGNLPFSSGKNVPRWHQ